MTFKKFTVLLLLLGFFLILIFLIIRIIFLKDEKIDVSNVNHVNVYITSREVEPSKRNLVFIGKFDVQGIKNLISYIEGGKTHSESFVISEYYLELLDGTGIPLRKIGLVLENNKLVGLDVTTKNPELLYVTSPHDLLVCNDNLIEKNLSKSIYEIINKRETSSNSK